MPFTGRGRAAYFFWEGSFDVSVDMLSMFYQTVVDSALFDAAVCWEGNLKKNDAKKGVLKKPV